MLLIEREWVAHYINPTICIRKPVLFCGAPSLFFGFATGFRLFPGISAQYPGFYSRPQTTGSGLCRRPMFILLYLLTTLIRVHIDNIYEFNNNTLILITMKRLTNIITKINSIIAELGTAAAYAIKH